MTKQKSNDVDVKRRVGRFSLKGALPILVLAAVILAPLAFWPLIERIATAVSGHVLPTPTIPPRQIATLAFENAAGEPVELTRFRGRPILVNVWATWCPPCREELPSLDRLQGLARETGIDVVAISVDRVGLDQIKAFLSVAGVKNLALYRGDPDAVLRAFAVLGLPTTVLLDSQGREIARLVGPTTWDAPEVVARLRALAASP